MLESTQQAYTYVALTQKENETKKCDTVTILKHFIGLTLLALYSVYKLQFYWQRTQFLLQ
jgi:hypothetical protein